MRQSVRNRRHHVELYGILEFTIWKLEKGQEIGGSLGLVGNYKEFGYFY